VKVKERVSPAQIEYFDRVRRRLLDVPWAQRQELLADLIARLHELSWNAAAEEALGTANEYARLAREAAGYGPSAPRRFAYIRAWRLRRKILVALTLVVVLVVVPAGLFVRQVVAGYQPLRTLATTDWSSAPRVEANVPSDTTYWRYRPGAAVVIGASLENTGRTTVTVTGFDVPTSPYGPIVPTALRVTRDPRNAGTWDHATPATRISIRPGENNVTVFVMMKMVPWEIGKGTFVWQGMPTLHLEVLGVHHEFPIDQRQKVGVVG
jgi:hypothetical protein